MPTRKKKKRKAISSNSQDLTDLFLKDRGKGLEDIYADILNFDNGIRDLEDLQYWMDMVKIKPAEAYKILHTAVIKNRKMFLKVFCLRHFGSHDIHVFLKAVKANGTAKVFHEEDPGKALKEFEKRTYYKRPKKIKTFTQDLTTIRSSVGLKRKRAENIYLD